MGGGGVRKGLDRLHYVFNDPVIAMTAKLFRSLLTPRTSYTYNFITVILNY